MKKTNTISSGSSSARTSSLEWLKTKATEWDSRSSSGKICFHIILFRFHSTDEEEEFTSLDDYISRMKDDQDTIMYLPGDSLSSIKKSPILKKYLNSGYEVLLLPDTMDEFTLQHLSEYEKKKVKSIAKDDVNVFGNDDIAKEKQKKLKEMYKPLTDFFKKHLGKKIEKVSISNKLVDEPLFILTSQYGYSAQMEKVNKHQAMAN